MNANEVRHAPNTFLPSQPIQPFQPILPIPNPRQPPRFVVVAALAISMQHRAHTHLLIYTFIHIPHIYISIYIFLHLFVQSQLWNAVPSAPQAIKAIPASSSKIIISWLPPDLPNGDIVSLFLYRQGDIIGLTWSGKAGQGHPYQIVKPIFI